MTASMAVATYRGKVATLPPPALIGQISDDWPVVGVLDPQVADLRDTGERTPARLFRRMRRIHFRPLLTLAPNSQRGYASDWRTFTRFCRELKVSALPASPRTLEIFIEYSLPYDPSIPYQYVLPESARRNVKVSVVKRALAAISKVHTWLDLPNPVKHPHVRDTLKINTRGRSDKAQKNAIPWEVIENALPTYGTTLRDHRATAAVTTQWSGGLRRSELTAIRVEHLQFPRDKVDGSLKVPKSKSNSKGKPDVRYICPEARRRLEAWMSAARITSGYVFRRLDRFGVLRPHESGKRLKPMHDNAVAHIWKDLAFRAGYTELEVEHISAHSARNGVVQTLSKNRFGSGQIQLVVGWERDNTAYYARGLDVYEGAMAQFFNMRDSAALPQRLS